MTCVYVAKLFRISNRQIYMEVALLHPENPSTHSMQNEVMYTNSKADCIQEFPDTPPPGNTGPIRIGHPFLIFCAPHFRTGNRSWHKASAYHLLIEEPKGLGSVLFSHSLTKSPPLSICPVGVYLCSVGH